MKRHHYSEWLKNNYFVFCFILFFVCSIQEQLYALPHDGDTIILAHLFSDDTLYYLELNPTTKTLTQNTTPNVNALWLVHTVKVVDTTFYSFWNIENQGYLNCSKINNTSLTLSSQPYLWKIISRKPYCMLQYSRNRNITFSAIKTVGLPLNGSGSYFQIITYSPKSEKKHLYDNCYKAPTTADTISQNFLCSETGQYQYVTADTLNHPLAFYSQPDTQNIKVSVDVPWIKYENSTFYVDSLSTQPARSGFISISLTQPERLLVFPLWQYHAHDTLTLQHVSGMGHLGIHDNLQAVHTRHITYYLNPDDSLWLTLPLNFGKDTLFFQRWYNFEPEKPLSSTLQFDADLYLRQHAGAVLIDKPYNTVLFCADTALMPLHIACDVSNYIDASLSNDTLYEPTLHYRVIYHLYPAEDMAQQASHKGAVGVASSSFLEEYQLIAPTDRVLRLSTEQHLVGNQMGYYAFTSNHVVKPIHTLSFYRNDTLISPFTIDSKKSLVLPPYKHAAEVTYTLVGRLDDGTPVNIARFRVDYRQLAQLSAPIDRGGLVSTEMYLKEYQINACLQDHVSSSDSIFNDWRLSELAPAYQTVYKVKLGDQRGLMPAPPMAGEYQLLDKMHTHIADYVSNSLTACQHWNDPSHTFCYVEPGNSTSTIAQFKFLPDTLNPNATYFISYLVSNLNSMVGSYPHLTLYIEGTNNDTLYHKMMQYASGDVNANVGEWQQAGLHFKLPASSYKSYRARLEYNAQNVDHITLPDALPLKQIVSKIKTNTQANDSALLSNQTFAIDQFSISQTIGSLHVVGRPDYCLPSGDSIEVAIAKLNCDSLLLVDSAWYYYRCLDYADMATLLSRPYRLYEGLYDSVMIKNIGMQTPNYPVYQADSVLNHIYNDSVPLFYTRDTIGNVVGVDLCMIFQSPQWQPCDSYIMQVATDNTFDSTTIVAQSAFIADGLCLYQWVNNSWERVSNGLSLTDTATISLAYQTLDTDLDTTWTQGYYDWLRGAAKDYQPGGFFQEYPYDSIVQALSSLHLDSSFKVNNQLPTQPSASLTQEQISLLSGLVQLDRLTLYQKQFKASFFDSINNLVVYPYGTTYDTLNRAPFLFPCEQPLPITVYNNDSIFNVLFGNSGEEGLMLGSFVVRAMWLALSQMSNSFSVPIISSSLQGAPAVSGNVRLMMSTDTSVLNAVGEVLYNSVIYDTINGTQSFKVSQYALDTMFFKIGYAYRLFFTIKNSVTSATLGYQYLDISVLPNQIKWTGNVNNSWNNIGNWQAVDSVGRPLTTLSSNFVSTTFTDVLIPVCQNIPILYADSSRDTGQTVNVDLYLDYNRNVARNIYIEPGAEFMGQQYLSYDSAYMDIKMATRQWMLLSAPIQGLVSGDLYVPSDSTDTSLFSTGNLCDGRSATPFWQSVYNSFVTSQTVSGSAQTGQLGWSSPANGVQTPFVPRTAFLVWVGTATSADTITMRWPKSDNRYYYYNGTTPDMNSFADIARPADYYKLAFIDSLFLNAPSYSLFSDSASIQLIGNPFMSSLSMSRFMEENQQFVGNYWLVRNGTLIAVSASGTSTSTEPNLALLYPYEGLFVQMQPDSLFVLERTRFLTSMTYASLGIGQNAPKQMQTIQRLRLKANYGGFSSYAIVELSPDADPQVDLKEDVPALNIGKNLTPSLLYTVTDQQALQINRLPSIDRLPLVLQPVDEQSYGQTFTLTLLPQSEMTQRFFLVDSLTNRYYPLREGSILTLPLAVEKQWRYYIASQEVESEASSVALAAVQIYTTSEQNVVLQSDEPIREVHLYDVLGRLIIQRVEINQTSWSVKLPPGVYQVMVILYDDREVSESVVVF